MYAGTGQNIVIDVHVFKMKLPVGAGLSPETMSQAISGLLLHFFSLGQQELQFARRKAEYSVVWFQTLPVSSILISLDISPDGG